MQLIRYLVNGSCYRTHCTFYFGTSVVLNIILFLCIVKSSIIGLFVKVYELGLTGSFYWGIQPLLDLNSTSKTYDWLPKFQFYFQDIHNKTWFTVRFFEIIPRIWNIVLYIRLHWNNWKTIFMHIKWDRIIIFTNPVVKRYSKKERCM